MQRRNFIKTLAITTPSLLVSPLEIMATEALSPKPKYDVSYLWHPNIENVLDYQEEVSRILGPTASKDLEIVKGAKNFGLIYDRNGNLESTKKVAENHSKILIKNGLTEATHIKDNGYGPLFNVSYGMGPNLDVSIKNFGKIYSQLGEGVGKNLFIEKTKNGNFALVYRRRGDKNSTIKISKEHSKLIKPLKMNASWIQENNNEVVYGESSLLNDKLETTPKKINKEKPSQIIQPIKESDLEAIIEKYIKNQRASGKISSDEKTSWSVYDFTTGEKLVDINEDQYMQAASMIKPFVALSFFHKVSEGEIKYGPKSKKHMELMIQKSDNISTNWVMQQVGGPQKVEEILKEQYQDIFQNTEVDEKIPKGGATYKNQASAHDYSRFLYALWKEKIPHSKEIKRLMSLPGRDRVYTGAKKVPSGTLVYNKTGSTAHLCGDMGILCAKGNDGKIYPYTLIGIIEKGTRPKNYGNWIASRGNVIREISNQVYTEMKKRHDLK